MGEAWFASACAARPTLRMGVSVRGDLPGAPHRRCHHHAGGEHRGHERASGRNQPPRLDRGDRLAGAGWRRLAQLTAAQSAGQQLLPLPPYSPELNPVENVWEFLRGNWLSHRVWDTYEAILDACQDAWNKLMQSPERIASLTIRPWAKPVTE